MREVSGEKKNRGRERGRDLLGNEYIHDQQSVSSVQYRTVQWEGQARGLGDRGSHGVRASSGEREWSRVGKVESGVRVSVLRVE